MQELRLGGLEPERALDDDPVEEHAEKLADLAGGRRSTALRVLEKGQ